MANQCNKDEYRGILEDICTGYCEDGHYCILKEFLVSLHPSPRLLMQLKCIDKMKYEKSKELDKDLGWAKCMEIWVEEGHALRFAECYDETIKFSSLYKKVMGGSKQKK